MKKTIPTLRSSSGHGWQWIFASFFLMSMLCNVAHAAAASSNVEISGNLVTEPCSLDAGSQLIPLSSGNIVAKYFYLTPRTPGLEFSIKLIDCDISLGTQAIVTFTGTESIALPGYLMPDDGDTHGIAFGIETMNGDLVPVNQASPIFTLSDGTNELKLKGFIQAEQDAIDKHTILTGPFAGTATFEITYP